VNFTASREEFADAQDKVQAKDETYLIGSARAALRNVGKKGWYNALLKRVEQVARTAYRRESGHVSSDTLRARLKAMHADLQTSLDKTTKPERKDIEARAKALAASLAAFANALGVEAAGQDDEDEVGLEWVTMHDERVREAHAAADGQVRRPGEKYEVGGVEMSRPGDVTAPIELWINCRCALRPTRLEPAAIAAAAAEYEAQGIGVFLLPADGDPILDISTENPPHVTVAFMGMTGEQDVDVEALRAAVDLTAAEFGPVEVEVKGRDELGQEGADVAFLDRDQMLDLRQSLVENDVIAEAMAQVEQYPEWLPHLTLGYPETPANDGDLPSTIRLDRLALFVGKDHYEYPLGGEMADTTDAVEQEVAADDLLDEEIDDIGEIDDAETVMWHGALAPEGVATGDGRKFALNSMRWRDLPLPLAWQKVNEPGHDGSVVVARIDRVWRDENSVLQGEGTFAMSAEADEVIGLIADGHLRGVSVDVDDATMSFEDEDGNEVTFDSVIDPETKITQVLTDGRVCGATICAIPAFAEAFVALGPHPNPPQAEGMLAASGEEEEFRDISAEERDKMAKDGRALPDGSFPIDTVEDLRNAISSVGRAKDPAKAKAHIKKRARALGEEGLIPDGWAAVAETFVKTEDGPGWLTHPVDTERLRRYWTKGKGAAKIRWGVPGDFNRCRAQLAKYIKPQYLSGYCANRHYDALGFWPGRPVSAETQPFGGEPFALVASASGNVMPAEWFADPRLPGPTRLTITDEGQVYGHLAEWDVCHIGIANACTTAPSSLSNYLYFATGVIDTTGGAMPVGTLTMSCGHAGPNASAKVAAAHYDNIGTAFAYVTMGEDEHGIWFSGGLVPGLTDEQVDAVRAAGSVSGDWRRIGEGLELVAALIVNVPGFPITPTQIAASGGHQTALVASGIVLDSAPKQTLKEIVASAVAEHLAEVEARQRMARLRKELGRDPLSRIERIKSGRGSA
jgi:hypothetical protein